MQQYQRIVLWSVAAAYICLIDRLAISVAIIPMSADYGWSALQQGQVMSVFFIGYVLLQWPAGWLADRVGGLWVLATGLLCWSLMTLLTPSAATLGFLWLLVCRFLLGLAEGVAWPATYTLFSQWVPIARRNFAIGLLNSSVSGGTIIAMLATPWLIIHYGWPQAFWVYGTLGLLWLLVGARFLREPAPLIIDAPAGDAGLAPQQNVDYADIQLFHLLRNRGVLSVVSAHFAMNWVIYLSLAWTPTFLSQHLGIDLADIGWLAVCPYLVSVVATPYFGRLGDQLIARGVDRRQLRVRMQAIALLGTAGSLAALGWQDSLWGALGIAIIANLCASTGVVGFSVNMMELAPSQAGALYGFSNAIASLGSAGGIFVAGWVLDTTGSWGWAFGSVVPLAVIGTGLYAWGAQVERAFK